MTRHARPLLFALILCFTSASLIAQSGTTKQKASPPKPDTEEIADSFQTNVVILHILAIDGKGNYVPDLKATDISITDEGVPQTVEYFAKDESPLRYVLLMDNSGSMEPFLSQLVRIGGSLVQSNRPGDETALVRFVDSDHIKVFVDFTENKQALAESLRKMRTQLGQTALTDAIYLAVQKAAERRAGEVSHHAVVLVTDGEERESYYKSSQLQKLLRRSGVPVFIIGLIDELDTERGFIRTSPREKAIKFLDMVAKESGGLVFYPKRDGELISAVNEIVSDMRSQYSVGYTPTNMGHDGKYHRIELKFVSAPGRTPVKIIARPGYFARGAEPAAEKKESKKGKN